MQPFHGEIFIEDPQLGKKSLYAAVGENDDGKLVIELHNANPPTGYATRVGTYGTDWTLKKIKKGFLVTVFEMTILMENPPVKARCVCNHKFASMLEQAIQSLR